MNTYQSWFSQFRQSKHYNLLTEKPLAYFSIEYALDDKLPTYAGGLGVLAGDYIKELFDQKIPAVAIGLYYQSKYGEIVTSETERPSPQKQGVTQVLDANHSPLLIKIPIIDH